MQSTIKRGVWLKDPQTGEDVCRRDYIKELYVNGSVKHEIPAGNRRAIVNHLRDYFDHLVPFQIVFQATAGCDFFVKKADEGEIAKIQEAAKKAGVRVAEDSKEANAVLDRITKAVSKK